MKLPLGIKTLKFHILQRQNYIKFKEFKLWKPLVLFFKSSKCIFILWEIQFSGSSIWASELLSKCLAVSGLFKSWILRTIAITKLKSFPLFQWVACMRRNCHNRKYITYVLLWSLDNSFIHLLWLAIKWFSVRIWWPSLPN